MLRALARVDVGAIERNCARLARGRRARRAVRGRQGRRLRPRRGAGRARGARRRRGVARGGDGGRGGRAARRGHRGAAARDGRAVAAGADGGAGARAPTWSPGASGSCARSRGTPPATAPACTSSSTPAWGGWARATPARRPRVADAVAAAPGLRLAGAMTHFATADDDPAFAREQLARFMPWAEALRARHGGACSLHAANSAATLGIPEARLDLVRCGIADLRHGPVRRGPGAPRARAGARAALLRRRGQADRAGRERRLRAPLRRRGADLDRHDPRRLRRRRAARADQRLRRARRRAAGPARRHGLDGQHHGRPRPRSRPSRAPRRS